MNQGLNCKLTLVSAPSGFGKTTLVADWMRGINQPVGWYSLDQNDNDLVTFLRYVVTAVQDAHSENDNYEACSATLSLLEAPILLAVDTLGTTFINDLSNLSQKMILVLDDIHLLEDASVYQFINMLLDHLPRQVHLVIIGRVDPNLPVPRLRVHGEINELRMADLRFKSSEFYEYLLRVVDPNFDEDAAIILNNRTEGWVASLRLAAVSMQSQKTKDFLNFSATFKGDKNQVMSYLTDEVLSRQSATIQYFLKQTAILDRFCAPLAEVLCGYSAAECIEIVDQLDIYII